MRPKRLPQSKSKSQTPSMLRHPGSPRPYSALLRALEPLTTKAVPSQSGPLSEPDPYADTPDIPIRVLGGHWYICNGHIKTPIIDDEHHRYFTRRDDAVTVAKYLASKTNGPINVIWW